MSGERYFDSADSTKETASSGIRQPLLSDAITPILAEPRLDHEGGSPGAAQVHANASAECDIKHVTMSQFMTAVAVPALVSNIGRQLVSPVLPVFAKQELGLSDAAVGLLLSLEGLGGVFLNIPAGAFASRFGAVMASFAGMSLQILAAFMAAFSMAAAQLFVARTVSGMSLSVWNIARQFFVSNAVSATDRGKASSITGGTLRVAQATGPLLGGFLADHISVRSVFLGQAVASGVTLLLVLVFMKPLDKHDCYGDKAKEKGGNHPSRRGVRGGQPHGDDRADTWRGCLAGACPCWPVIAQCWRELLGGGLYGMMLMAVRNSRPLLFPLVGHSIGLSKTAIGAVQAAGAAMDSCLIFIAGWISDRYGRKWSGLPSSIILGLAFLLLAYARSLPVLVAASVLAGFGNGFSSGIINLLGADSAAHAGAYRGEYLGIFRTLTDSGSMLGPLVVGSIAATTSLEVACLCVGVTSAVSAIWLASCYWCLSWLTEPWDTADAVSASPLPASEYSKLDHNQHDSDSQEDDEYLLQSQLIQAGEAVDYHSRRGTTCPPTADAQ